MFHYTHKTVLITRVLKWNGRRSVREVLCKSPFEIVLLQGQTHKANDRVCQKEGHASMHLGSDPHSMWISKEVSGHRPACLKLYQWGICFMSLHLKAVVSLSLNAFGLLKHYLFMLQHVLKLPCPMARQWQESLNIAALGVINILIVFPLLALQSTF